MLNFLLETFRLGVTNLRLHKLRSFLTALGIIFGVFAVIVMVAIGEGTKQAALAQLKKLGARNIVLASVKPAETNEGAGRTTRVLTYGLKRADLDRIRTLPNISKIVPMRNTEQYVSYAGTMYPAAHPIGATPDLFEVVNLQLSRGMLFNQTHYDNRQPVCVIGDGVAKQVFPYKDPLGELLQIGSSRSGVLMARVIGVLEPSGLRTDGGGNSVIDRDMDFDVYVPQSAIEMTFGDTIMRVQAGSMERKVIELSEIWIQADSVENVEAVAGIINNVLESTHPQRDTRVKVPLEILRSAEQLNRMFNFIMVGTASLSLLVGGIGIMNIMLATVTERTREIGIRRALGAKQKHITLQFLIETTLISLCGGLIGIGAGCAAALALPRLVEATGSGNYPTSITTWSVLISFVISGATGIVFGLYPAWMAARMNPIEALRHE